MRMPLKNQSALQAFAYKNWVRILLMIIGGVCLAFFFTSIVKIEAARSVQEKMDDYLVMLQHQNVPVDAVEAKKEMAELKTEVAALSTAVGAPEKEASDTITLGIAALTLLISIAVPYFGVEFVTDYISRSGEQVADQTGEMIQAELNRTQGLVLTQLQFSKARGWQRNMEIDYRIEEQLIFYGEKALSHAVAQEELLEDADFKIDFAARFPSSTSAAMKNNLLFFLSLLNAIDMADSPRASALETLRQEQANRAREILEEMEKATSPNGSRLMTQVRAEINFFDLWHERPAREKALAALREKLKKARELLKKKGSLSPSAQSLMSDQSTEWCEGRLKEIHAWIHDSEVKIYDLATKTFIDLTLNDARAQLKAGTLPASHLARLPPWNTWRPLPEVLA